MNPLVSDPAYQSEMRDKISKLEELLLSAPDDLKADDQLEVTHHFDIEGAYVRECYIPAGTYGTGKIHAKDTCNLVARGKIVIVTEHGSGVFKKGDMFMTPPGTKKAYFAVEDTVFTNVQMTDAKTADEVEADVIQDEYNPIQIRKPSFEINYTFEVHV